MAGNCVRRRLTAVMSEEGKRLTSGQSARTPWAEDSGLGKIEQQRKAEQKGSARQAGRWLGIDCQQGKGRSECAIRPKQALQTRVDDMATQGAAAQEAKQAAKQSTAPEHTVVCGGAHCTWRKRWRCRMAAGIAWRVHLGQSRGPAVCLSKLEPERARTKLTRPREEGIASLSVLGMVRHP